MREVLALLRVGDWLLLLGAGMTVLLLWQHGSGGDRVVIKREGRLYLETTPRLDREIAVPGPLGDTVVEIRAGRVRVKSDPGPHQVCVRQGWLMPGQVAICLPNRVSIERGVVRYDSLNY
ncbi:MAG: NusG domain II-containing protein [Gallionellaceae bacterium]|nr:NusG domain II-containing protein [Gallionellaceae bacterium]